MGFNTTVFILNDQFARITSDPQGFVDHIYHRMSYGRPLPGDPFNSAVTVPPSKHAYDPRLYFTQGNLLTELSVWSQATHDLATSGRTDELRRRIGIARTMLDRLEHELDEMANHGPIRSDRP